MIRTTLLLLLMTGMIFSGFAQDSTRVDSVKVQQPKPKQDRIYFGGNIGLTFGNYSMLGIYPMVGYKLTPKLSVGVKLAYEYIRDKRYTTDYETSNYGGSLFARYRVIQPIYLHAEYAGLNYELYNFEGESEREWVPFFLVGAGYSKLISSRTWLNIQVLFDVLQNEKSPYKQWEPFYSIGVGVGF